MRLETRSWTLLGLLGPAGAGKTTVAKFLVERYGATRYALAAPLKTLAQRVFGFSDAQLYGSQADKDAVDPRWGVSPREALQRLGTDGCREVLGPDVWLDALFRRIHAERPRFAVIDDVRFPNEARAIHAAGGRVWRFEREGVAIPPDTSHRSEREWREAPFDLCISAPLSPGARRLLAEVESAVQTLSFLDVKTAAI